MKLKQLIDLSIFDWIFWPLKLVIGKYWEAGSSRHAYIYDHILTPIFFAMLSGYFSVKAQIITLSIVFVLHTLGKELIVDTLFLGKGSVNWVNLAERMYGVVIAMCGLILIGVIL